MISQNHCPEDSRFSKKSAFFSRFWTFENILLIQGGETKTVSEYHCWEVSEKCYHSFNRWKLSKTQSFFMIFLNVCRVIIHFKSPKTCILFCAGPQIRLRHFLLKTPFFRDLVIIGFSRLRREGIKLSKKQPFFSWCFWMFVG